MATQGSGVRELYGEGLNPSMHELLDLFVGEMDPPADCPRCQLIRQLVDVLTSMYTKLHQKNRDVAERIRTRRTQQCDIHHLYVLDGSDRALFQRESQIGREFLAFNDLPGLEVQEEITSLREAMGSRDPDLSVLPILREIYAMPYTNGCIFCTAAQAIKQHQAELRVVMVGRETELERANDCWLGLIEGVTSYRS